MFQAEMTLGSIISGKNLYINMLLLSYVKVSSEWKHDCCQFLDSVRCICPTGPLDRLHAQLGSMGHEKEREALQQIAQTGFHT